jgi:hypothetical protein
LGIVVQVLLTAPGKFLYGAFMSPAYFSRSTVKAGRNNTNRPPQDAVNLAQGQA